MSVKKTQRKFVLCLVFEEDVTENAQGTLVRVVVLASHHPDAIVAGRRIVCAACVRATVGHSDGVSSDSRHCTKDMSRAGSEVVRHSRPLAKTRPTEIGKREFSRHPSWHHHCIPLHDMDVKDLLRPGDGDGDDRARPDFEERQTKTYAGATAQSIPQAAVADLRNFLRDSAPPKSYDAHANVRFLYEIMCKPGWEDEVKKVVLPWIEVRHMRRALDGCD